MNILRLKFRRRPNDGWANYNSGSDRRHSLCYYEFARFFRVARGVREIEVCISRQNPGGDDVYKMRVRRDDWGGAYFHYFNERTEQWDFVPLTGSSRVSIRHDIENHRWSVNGTFFVWVEHD
jgi:hypothetical protein